LKDPNLFVACLHLLQFDSEDYKMIEEGKKKLSWWGTVEPILIGQASTPTPAPLASSLVTGFAGSPAPTTPQHTSAEVSVSREAPMTSGPKKTSLQF
jgi:hypothetical protein